MSFWKGLVWSREHIGLVFAPLAFAALLSLVVTLLWHDDIPQGLDAHEWANFTRKIEYALDGEDTTRGLMLFLLFLHALQTLVCFPLLHIAIAYECDLGVFGFFFSSALRSASKSFLAMLVQYRVCQS